MDKAPDAFRTISEVADDLKVPQHVLRFWESRFSQIKPMKRAGGRRYYRPDDVDLLRGIHHLLYGEGYTIRGVQRILRDQGLKFVQQVWLPDAEPPPHGHFDDDSEEGDGDAGEAQEAEQESEPESEQEGGEADRAPRRMASPPIHPQISPAAPRAALSREDLRKLQAALFELAECRRLLDRAADPSVDAAGDPSA